MVKYNNEVIHIVSLDTDTKEVIYWVVDHPEREWDDDCCDECNNEYYYVVDEEGAYIDYIGKYVDTVDNALENQLIEYVQSGDWLDVMFKDGIIIKA